MRGMADASTKSIRANLSSINAIKNSKTKCVGQFKPLESAVEDVVADLCKSSGSFNKLLMDKSSPASNSGDHSHFKIQHRNLSKQVKELSGAAMG
jgi:hypothetical protein